VGALTLPTGGTVYTDAQVLIYSVEQHPKYAPLLVPLWQAVQAGSTQVVTSELSILETLVKPIQNGDAALVQTYELFFVQPGFQTASDFAANPPDAIHAATAELAACTLVVTNDQIFRRCSGLPVVVLDDLVP
jgi:predicted nucleic acid-binding protein